MTKQDFSSYQLLLERLLQFPWPDCAESDMSEELVIAPVDRQNLNQLMSLFGLPFSVETASIEELQYAHTVVQVGFGLQVRELLRTPDATHALVQGWPEDWVKYLKAVASGDSTTSKKLAKQLNVGTRNCDYPAGVDLNELMKALPH